ncbi:hypothetical protein L211DRAFT_783370, partial [Terfezia boudieri ATCC MYA-4762]
KICSLYVLDIQVSTIRSRIRQEFERHRYVKLPVVDVLLLQSPKEYQEIRLRYLEQFTHMMKYSNAEEYPPPKVSQGLMQNFLEVGYA